MSADINVIDYELTLDAMHLEPFDYFNKKISSTKGEALVLLINLVMSGIPYDLTDLSITAGLIKPNKDKFTVHEGEFLEVIGSPVNGQIKLTLTDDLIDSTGRTLLQIQVKDFEGKQITFLAMLYFIHRKPNEVVI